MFERKIKKDYLNLAKVAYGGEFYYNLGDYRLVEINIENTKFSKVTDSLLSQKGDTKFFSYKNAESGFVANVFEHIKNKTLVIAYRGTERLGLGENVSDIYAFMNDVSTDINLMTSNFDMQFQDAWSFYLTVKNQFKNRKIVIVGQSLGGALAQIIPAKEYTVNRKKIEAYTYNAPGCAHLLDMYGCNTKLNYLFITNYSVMNDWCGMFGEHVGKTYVIRPIEIRAIKSDAVADVLTNVLLSTHEGIFDYTEETMGKVRRKPRDFGQIEGLSLWYFDKNNPIKDNANISDFLAQNEQKFDLSENDFIKKTGEFLKENVPIEIQNSGVGLAVKKAADNFISSSNEQMAKWNENINNNSFSVAMKILDSIASELSLATLERANKILNKMKF